MDGFKSTIILEIEINRVTKEACERRWKVIEDVIKAYSGVKVNIVLNPDWEPINSISIKIPESLLNISEEVDNL